MGNKNLNAAIFLNICYPTQTHKLFYAIFFFVYCYDSIVRK